MDVWGDNQFQKLSGQHCYQAKAKYILGHVTQGQENVRRKGYCVIIIKKYCIQLIICNNYILNKISFNRNTHKTSLFIDWLTKMLWPVACRKLTSNFSQRNGLVFANSIYPNYFLFQASSYYLPFRFIFSYPDQEERFHSNSIAWYLVLI